MESSIANPSPAKVIGRANECVRRLLEAGLPFDALQMPIDDLEMRKRLVRFWLVGGYKPTTSQERAREVMGKNFLGVEEALQHFFGVKFSKQDLARLSEVPYPAEVLEAHRDTYILVAVPEMSISDMRAKHQNLFRDTGKEVKPYWIHSFTQERDKVAWHLVRKTQVDNSAGKTWEQQIMLLGEHEEAPSANVGIYTTIVYFLATGEMLFKKTPIRCSDTIWGEQYGWRTTGHVALSSDDKSQIVVSAYGFEWEGPGIGSCRKIPTLDKQDNT